MRLTPNFHVGLVLGITTAGLVLALSGCATTSMTTGNARGAEPAGPSAGSDPSAILAEFSADEQERILAVQGIVERAANEHELDPALINAMIWVESRFQPRAKSPAGARGLMQLMPATAAYLAKRMGENNARAYDPEFNIHAGSFYLAQMLDKFGDEQLAVAAYHAGPGNVKRWVEAGERFPDYSEAYVAKVMAARDRFEGVDALHGRPSGGRSGAAGVVGRDAEREAKVGSDPDDDALEVPDVDSLPDAADIHGVPRVIYSDDRSEPEPEPESNQPVAKPETPRVEPRDEFEPVFVVHPELDANPAAPPTGWETRKPQRRPRPQAPAAPPTQSKPEQPQAPEQAEPEPKPEDDSPETGIGVLPDL